MGGRVSKRVRSKEYGVLITERTDPELEITDYGVRSTERTDPYPQPFVIRNP